MVSVDSPHLHVASGAVLTITLDRPARLNAIDVELAEALRTLLEDCSDDPTEPILIEGAGDGSLAGVDTDLVSAPEFESTHADFQATIHRVFDLLRRYPRPIAVAGERAVVGGGLVFALNADFAVVSEDTTISFPEIKLGLTSTPTLHILADQIGDRLAKQLVMTGSAISAARAREVGLVNDVVAQGEAATTARAYLEQTLEHDPDIVAEIKRSLDHRHPETFWGDPPDDDAREPAL